MDRLTGPYAERRRAPVVLLVFVLAALGACASKPGVTLSRDDAAGRLTVLVGGREALVFQYGPDLDMPHYWPMRSPSGKNMLVQKTEPYPHHRSFWFADTVRAEGGERDLSFYNGLYSGVKAESGDYGPPFRDRIRLVSFDRLDAAKGRAVVEARLVWESDGRPVLDEARRLVVHSLGAGRVPPRPDLDAHGLPRRRRLRQRRRPLRLALPPARPRLERRARREDHLRFRRPTGQEATNMKPALWIDYSGTVDGEDGRRGRVPVARRPRAPLADPRIRTVSARAAPTTGAASRSRSGKASRSPSASASSSTRGDVVSGRVRERYEAYAGRPLAPVF